MEEKTWIDTLNDVKNVVGKDGVNISVTVRLMPETYAYLLGIGFLLWGLNVVFEMLTKKSA